MGTSRRIRVSARLVAALLTGLAAVLALPAPAQAHTEVENTFPVADARLRATPDSVRLVFNEAVPSDFATVVVRAPDGENLAQGPVRGSDAILVQPIAPATQPGVVEVAYRVVSADGHPVSGSYTFRVRRPSPAGTPTAAETAEPAAETGQDTGQDTATPAPAAPSPAERSEAAAPGDGGTGTETMTGPALGAGAVALVVVFGAVSARRRRRETHTAPPGP